LNDNNPPQRNSKTAGGSRPGVALADVIAEGFRRLRADGPGDEGERAGEEWRALELWCRETGFWLLEDAGPEREGGREHDVRFEPELRRWIKFTKPWMAGYAVDLEAEPLLLPATPLQYFLRMEAQNHLFGDDVRFMGLWPDKAGLRIVVSQPDWIGEAPTFEDIETSLNEQGYRRINLPPLGNYEAHSYLGDGVALFDVHPRNCIVQSSGLLIPFDCIAVVLTDDELMRLSARS